MIGIWSELRAGIVCQCVYGSMAGEAMERSGELAVSPASLVAELSLITPMLEAEMASATRCPRLSSSSWLYHRPWCALKSPSVKTNFPGMFSRLFMGGEYCGAHDVSFG